MNIGDKLKLLRQSKKITQIELAKLLNKSVSTIQKYESNKVLPSINILQEISQKLNIDISYFTDQQQAYKVKGANNNKDKFNFDFITNDGIILEDELQDTNIEKFISAISTYRSKIYMVTEEINKTNNNKLIHAFNNLMEDLKSEIQSRENTIRELEDKLIKQKNDKNLEFQRLLLECINLVETEAMKQNSYKEPQTARCGPIFVEYKRDKDTNGIILAPNMMY